MNIFLVILGICALFLIFRFAGRGVDRKQEKLFQDQTSSAADVRGMCYLRECSLEEPAVAQVIDGCLVIHTVTGKALSIPLNQIRVVSAHKNHLTGRYPWFGKTIFKLETPKTSGLALGFKDPQPWKPYFKMV